MKYTNDSQRTEQAFQANEGESSEELSLLLRISTMLDQSLYLDDVIQPILNVLAESMGILRGAITLLNRSTGEIQTEASFGLSYDERRKGRYRLGEGITGSVVATGKPRYIPDISAEPQFLDKTGTLQLMLDKTASFICVPIKIGTKCIGTFSVVEYFIDEKTMHRHINLFTIIASLISQAVKLRQKILETHEYLIKENNRLQTELSDRYRPANILGDSAAMQGMFDLWAQACLSDKPVLVRGEAGTGKEIIATAIHYNSQRSHFPHAKIRCIAVPAEIIEEELFGFEQKEEKSTVHKPGKIEQAQGGTLLLVEIADVPVQTQKKLLDFIQNKTFEVGGSHNTVQSHTRITATTSKDLEALANQGKFDREFLKILSAQSIYIPPLRERKSDIPQLTNHFIELYAEKHHKRVSRISTGTINMLMGYHWPGNVSELESCIERAILVAEDRVIHPHHLPPTLQTAEHTNTTMNGSLENALNKLEKSMILDALKVCRGSLHRAAKVLQVTERVLGLRVKKHNIDVATLK